MATRIPVNEQPFYVGESRWIGFDYQNLPEVVNDETLSSPDVPAVSGLTISGVEVNTEDFDPGDGDPIIPAGKGVIALVSAAAAGTYFIYSTVTLSGGGTGITVQGKMKWEARRSGV